MTHSATDIFSCRIFDTSRSYVHDAHNFFSFDDLFSKLREFKLFIFMNLTLDNKTVLIYTLRVLLCKYSEAQFIAQFYFMKIIVLQ